MSALDELFSGDDSRAEQALAQVDAALLPALESALAGADPERRWWAARALAEIEGQPATAALLRALADADPDVRAVAAHALGLRRAPEAVAPLLASLAGAGEYLARLAADALTAIGKPAVPRLLEALEKHDNPSVRANAARALAAIGETPAIPALFNALSDESALVQYWAEEGLERMDVGQVYFKP